MTFLLLNEMSLPDMGRYDLKIGCLWCEMHARLRQFSCLPREPEFNPKFKLTRLLLLTGCQSCQTGVH